MTKDKKRVLKLVNPPGLSRINYRVGTYTSFVRRMWDRAHSVTVLNTDGQPHRPLAQMDTRVKDAQQAGKMDFGMALLDAWAGVCDVLAFYTERFANETYLPTATEVRSVGELAHMVGYRPDPGLSATAYTAFKLTESANAVKVASVPAGTRLESVSKDPDAKTQHFETSRDLKARLQWNQLSCHHPVVPKKPVVTTGASRLILARHGHMPRVDDLLLIKGTVPGQASPRAIEFVRTISDVSPETSQIVISWKNPVVDDQETFDIISADLVIDNPELLLFTRKSSLFGHNAPLWEDIPEEARLQLVPPDGGLHVGSVAGMEWQQVGSKLPSSDVRCLAVHPDGYLFISLVGKGLFRSADGGRTWLPSSMGLASLDILSLVFDDDRFLYAGLADGKVFRSVSNGASWSPIQADQAKARAGFFPETEGGPLPVTAVRCVLPMRGKIPFSFINKLREILDISSILRLLNPKTYLEFLEKIWEQIEKWGLKLLKSLVKFMGAPLRWLRSIESHETVEAKEILVFAGTELGVFRFEENGWHAVNKGLPRLDNKTGYASLTIFCLISLGHRLLAATDLGVFSSRDYGASWQPSSRGLPAGELGPGPKVTCLIRLNSKPGSSIVLAGTEKGVYRSQDNGRNWTSANKGLPQSCAVRNLAAYGETEEEAILLVATNVGIFTTGMGMANWTTKNEQLRVRLFDLERHWAPEIDAGLVPIKLRTAFRVHDIRLSPHAVIRVNKKGEQWTIVDKPNNAVFHLLRRGPNLAVERRITDIDAMALGKDGQILIATPPGTYRPVQWPDFWINDGQIDLSEKLAGLTVGTKVLLSQADRVALLSVDKVSTFTRSSFSETHTVTRIGTEIRTDLDDFDLRRTEVYLLSENLELFWAKEPTQEPVYGDYLDAIPRVPDLPVRRTLIISGRRSRARLGPVGGVFTINSGKGVRDGLAHHHIHAIAADSRARIYAATDTGIYCRTQNGWIDAGLKNKQVSTLVIHHKIDEIFAGTMGEEAGLFRKRDNCWRQLPLHFEIIDLVMHHQEDILFAAGAEKGIWISEDYGDSWAPINAGLRRTRITCLALIPNAGLLAGTTEHGIFYLARGQERWRPINEGLNDLQIQSISVGPQGDELLLGTRNRVFRCEQPGQTWTAYTRGLPFTPITALFHHGKRRYAGTSGSGLYVNDGDAIGWRAIHLGISNHVSALGRGEGQEVWVGTQAFSVLKDDHGRPTRLAPTPLFSIENNARLEPGSFLQYLAEPFLQNGIHLSEEAELHPIPKFSGWLVREGFDRMFSIFRDGRQLRAFRPSESMFVAAPPGNQQGGHALWQLQREGGARLNISACPGEIIWESAREEDPQVGERRILMANKAEDGDFSRLVFDKSLRHFYDRASLSVYGNVVAATHGKTVEEVLGHGKGDVANQQYSLKLDPLTFLPGEHGPRPALEVRVNPGPHDPGVTWKLAESLFPGAPDHRHYILRRPGTQKHQLIFGDGLSGARLPTGYNNVQATYRYGLGEEGNVEAESLTSILNKPLGIKSSTNPLPAEGGANPESPDSIRKWAPLTTRPLDRIVSLGDCRDMVALYPGIEKVTATPLWTGTATVGHLTVVAANGTILDKDSDYYNNLIKLINNSKAQSIGRILVDSFVKQTFNIAGVIRLKPHAKADEVLHRVEQKLLTTYNIQNTHFGDDIIGARLVKVISDVEGVLSAELRALYPEGAGPSLVKVLKAKHAYWDKGRKKARASQLLIINENGINLSIAE